MVARRIVNPMMKNIAYALLALTALVTFAPTGAAHDLEASVVVDDDCTQVWVDPIGGTTCLPGPPVNLGYEVSVYLDPLGSCKAKVWVHPVGGTQCLP